MSVKADRTKLLLKLLILETEIERTFCEVSSGNHDIDMHVLAVGVMEITIILGRDSDIQIFLNGDVFLNES